jgi:hypothetical protein
VAVNEHTLETVSVSPIGCAARFSASAWLTFAVDHKLRLRR